MEDNGRVVRKWEEEIYWAHFGSVRFFQTLSGRYHHQLSIPKKFVNNLKEKLVGAVSLRGPSGVLWKVGLTTSGDTLYFREGWKEFVEDHSLQENDVLIFKYIGNSWFDVLMFDHESLCEKEGSYFIKRCQNGEVNGGCKRKDNSRETVEATNESSHDVFHCAPSKRPRKDDAWTPRSRGRPSRGSKNRSSSCGLGLSSHRRQVNEEEKEKALQAASEAASEYSFIIVMRPSHVYKGFYLSFPSAWARTHLPNQSQDITLQVKDKTWKVRYYKRDIGGGLTGGWRRFVKENFLEEFDVCLFNLVTKTTDALVMDVSIFRVEENAIPVSRATPINRKGRFPKNI